MSVTLEIEGLNLEKLLRAAAQEGVVLRNVYRSGERTLRVRVGLRQRRALEALCARFGWMVREVRAGLTLRAARWAARRSTLVAAALLGIALAAASSRLLLRVEILGAGENEAAVRTELLEAGVRPGRLRRALSTDSLRARLEYALPGLSFAGVRFEGSTLVVNCQRARIGEELAVPGEGLDLIASQPGIVTRIWASSGTPAVEAGQAVRAGQVLVRGEERTAGGEVYAVRAEGQVYARVWAQGEAQASLWHTRTVETGRQRERVTVVAPWGERVMQEAERFDSQDEDVRVQPIVGLFLPAYRRVETFAETVKLRERRTEEAAAALALGAAEEIAKKRCPVGSETLDKWANYSMIDDEFIYATVVIEVETGIAQRAQQTQP
ncbi:MAG: sporulation protein YqfD [Clostridiales bacterium]|nr:sporulation protein YqfD [Clostridiales bacterium]